jgi:hypothetical protein
MKLTHPEAGIGGRQVAAQEPITAKIRFYRLNGRY